MEDRGRGTSQVGGQMDRREEAGAVGFRATFERPVAHHHVAGQILRLRSQAIGTPGAQARPPHLPVATVHEVQRWRVIELGVVAAAHHGQPVGMG